MSNNRGGRREGSGRPPGSSTITKQLDVKVKYIMKTKKTDFLTALGLMMEDPTVPMPTLRAAARYLAGALFGCALARRFKAKLHDEEELEEIILPNA